MYIAGILEKNNYGVKILDAYLERLNQVQISKRVLSYKPDIIGITTDSANYYESLKIAKLIKNISNAIVVLGGPHASIRPNQMILYPEVDIVVFGEGEYTMLEIVQRIENKMSLENCLGCYAKENNKILYNIPRPRIKDLDEIPMPTRHLLPYHKYPRNYSIGGLTPPVDTINTSRGCPYNCAFCSSRIIWGKKYIYRTPKNVVNEIEYLIKNYGTKGIYFREDNFTLKRSHVLGICKELQRRNIKIEWECSSRVDIVDRELLKIMHESGCKAIWFGIESGSDKTLEKISKGITVKKSREAIKLTREANIKAGGSFIIGIPGESMEDIKKTIDLIKELKLKPSAIHYFYGIPDSPLYQEVIKNNLIDSAYGDIFFVRTEIFDKKLLQNIISKIQAELRPNINRILFKKLFKRAKEISISFLKNPRNIKEKILSL